MNGQVCDQHSPPLYYHRNTRISKSTGSPATQQYALFGVKPAKFLSEKFHSTINSKELPAFIAIQLNLQPACTRDVYHCARLYLYAQCAAVIWSHLFGRAPRTLPALIRCPIMNVCGDWLRHCNTVFCSPDAIYINCATANTAEVSTESYTTGEI